MPLNHQAISATDIAVSGLKAQRVRMNVLANNIANSLTTRTAHGGGAFRRQLTIFRGNQLGNGLLTPDRFGVQAKRITPDRSPLRQVFDPGHPDANSEGYVSYPNVDIAVEMVDLISSQRAYEANVAVILSNRQIRNKALEIIQVR